MSVFRWSLQPSNRLEEQPSTVTRTIAAAAENGQQESTVVRKSASFVRGVVWELPFRLCIHASNTRHLHVFALTMPPLGTGIPTYFTPAEAERTARTRTTPSK